jgi:hypothetical protein
MASFGMLLKSYGRDAAYAHRLVESFHVYNEDDIPLWIVVPTTDLPLFEPLAGRGVTVLSESRLQSHLVDRPLHGLRPGYINQEIVKLSFWELGLVDAYFCVDSEAVFIRPFRRDDFMRDSSTPYTVLVEDHELAVEPRYHREYWDRREQEIRLIQELVGLDDPVIRTCHGHQVFSSVVLRSFVEDFLKPRGWSYADALERSPYEFSWYNMWLQRTHVIPIHPREPFVKVFHHEGQHLEYILRGITVDDIARGYLAVVANSSYSRDLGLVDADAPKPQALAPYLSYHEVGQLLAAKARGTLRRRLKR